MADSGYCSALSAQGYSGNETFQYAGKTVDHGDVAMAFEDSYRRHRGEYVPVCGAKARVNKKIHNQYLATVKDDVKTQFGLSGWTIGLAIALGIVGGIGAFVVAVIACLFEYYLTKDLDGDKAMRAMLGAS